MTHGDPEKDADLNIEHARRMVAGNPAHRRQAYTELRAWDKTFHARVTSASEQLAERMLEVDDKNLRSAASELDSLARPFILLRDLQIEHECGVGFAIDVALSVLADSFEEGPA